MAINISITDPPMLRYLSYCYERIFYKHKRTFKFKKKIKRWKLITLYLLNIKKIFLYAFKMQNYKETALKQFSLTTTF